VCTMNPNIDFRPYQRTNLPVCAIISIKVFPPKLVDLPVKKPANLYKSKYTMDPFVHYILRYKSKSVSVPTDKATSLWFYERYVFGRWT
jgi:hypothetical protein